jgi:hypothetical protein
MLQLPHTATKATLKMQAGDAQVTAAVTDRPKSNADWWQGTKIEDWATEKKTRSRG